MISLILYKALQLARTEGASTLSRGYQIVVKDGSSFSLDNRSVGKPYDVLGIEYFLIVFGELSRSLLSVSMVLSLTSLITLAVLSLTSIIIARTVSQPLRLFHVL